MDFEKKYPLSQFKGEFVLVQWTRGYKQVEVYYKEELVAQVNGAGKLQKGVTILTEQLGELKLKLSQQPVLLDVIVEGIHSPVNVSHPVKELKKTTTYFWMLSAFSFIAGSVEVGVFREVPPLATAISLINFLVLATYVTSGILLRRGIPVGFYLGFGMLCFTTIISLLVLVNGYMWGFILYIFQVIRFGGVALLATNLKTAIQATKHKKFKVASSQELLDSSI